MDFSIEQRIWTHEPPPGREDVRGQLRFVVLHEDGEVYDHYPTLADAQRAIEAFDPEWY